jgi:hypothetical protein
MGQKRRQGRGAGAKASDIHVTIGGCSHVMGLAVRRSFVVRVERVLV